ncbi:hypothetical protein [Nonomuraea wenchangensis]|uniref:Uncharacterized protein n=1 Tax=Nonomuraea wenchangensis TaxID=568860 RepID=A0A1I0LGS0_9ACTN|nr:hypothetical protein [Nonomuraea wenchangensis]SEU38763.1 hypothetical protein SAMN05421811_11627 [Nonomuraea wenchangensis]
MRKIALGFVSALVGGAMLVTGAGAASASTATKADTRLFIRSITPNPVVVKKGAETTAFIHVRAGSDVKKVEVTVAPVDGVNTLRAKDVKPLESWRFSVGFTDGDAFGKWKATAVAFDGAGKEVAKDDAYFAVELAKTKADTRVSRFEAEPHKVRKGKSIYFSGRLQADDHRWKGVRGEKVNIFYRANGHSAWKWVTSTTTKWDGKFFAKTKAYKSGWFRASFAGNDELNSSTSRADYVRVYGSWWRR